MAIYHCSISNVSRAGGSSSIATLAYISGEKVHDDRLDKTYQYARSERVLATGTILPDYAPAEYADPKTLFNAIEQYETSDKARTAKKIEVALPKELDRATQKKIVEDYIRNNLTSQGYCATYALHDGNEKKNYNDHAHIIVTNRPINAKGEWGCKRKMAYALDEDGKRIPALEYEKDEKGKFLKDENGNKIPVLGDDGKPIQKKDGKGTPQWVRINLEVNPLDTKDFLFHLRKEWAAEVNKHLAPEQQIDHRSNAARGIEDTPMIHEGYAARAIEERGEVSERCQTNREIKAENEQRRQIRAELAATIEQDKALARKERDLHERLGRVDGRRKDDESTRRITDGERAVTGESTAVRATNTDDTTTREQADRADRLRAILERREREAAEIRRVREEAARRERDAAERKLTAERKAAELRRQREAESRKHQPTPETQKRERPSQQPAKSTEQSHGYTFTR